MMGKDENVLYITLSKGLHIKGQSNRVQLTVTTIKGQRSFDV